MNRNKNLMGDLMDPISGRIKSGGGIEIPKDKLAVEFDGGGTIMLMLESLLIIKVNKIHKRR